MDRKRLLELAGVPLTENQISWDEAVRVIAAHILSGANTEALDSGDAEVDEYVEELMDGRWQDDIGDQLRDLLTDRVNRNQQ